MKSPLRHGALALILGASLLAARPAPAQDRAQPGAPVPQERAAGRDTAVLSVDFKGGTVEEYLKALERSAEGKPVNVVVPEEAKVVPLPAITLRKVRLRSALEAIQAAFSMDSEHMFDVRPIGDENTDMVYSLRYGRSSRSRQGAQPGRPSAERHLEVFSIRDLIDPPSGGAAGGSKVEYTEILAAIDGAMSLSKEPAPEILFHKETGLLLVGGSPAQTAVISVLLARVHDDLVSRWKEEAASRRNSASQARALTIARTELQLAEREASLAEDRFLRSRKLADSGNIPVEQVAEAELALARAMGLVERRRLEAAQVSEEMAANDGPGRTVVVYDLADLQKRDPQVAAVVGRVADLAGARSEKATDSSVVINATEPQHAAIKALLESMRRLGSSMGDAKR